VSYDKLFGLFCLGIVYLGMASKKIKSSKINKNTDSNTDDDTSHLYTDNLQIDNIGSRRKPYSCDICDYSTYKKSNYDKHLSSIKHVKKVAIKNSMFQCDSCGYVTANKSYYDKHLTTIKHIMNIAFTKSQKEYQYNCNVCNYHTNQKYNYDKHIMSKNHIKINAKEENDDINEDTISSIMSEIKMLMAEQNKMNKIITDIANKPSTNVNSITNANNTFNNNHNQTNNQQFNLNFFLNETCKDAMNLSEFLENMHVSMEDMEKTGELGFAKGMSRIIMNNLNAIDVCKRPIHCSDVKRETLYVKNNGVWEKETEDRKRTKEIIYKVSCLNERQLIKWRDLPRNKGYEKSDHMKNDEFMNLVMEINKMRNEEIDKVITSISKCVSIDKDKVKMSGYLN